MSMIATAADLRGTVAQPATRPKNAIPDTVSLRSRVGLNAANFFLAEITGVVMPFLGDYLKERQWSESAIGFAIAQLVWASS